ncbi:voltage-gated potassium channel [Paenibacillus sp. 1_12]|uniref:potassium channel family protein n=1 Tax=Paenibacillus sp. 1_12 TaxID=1566278 RepID=UPI0008E81814|nr:potassium channel family protein [Paenibacillus sp. 1_12]SFL23112.1 voltage-gated potassium channel [Paenibacillus sp. 1_12]
MGKSKIQLVYEIGMLVLALISISFIWVEENTSRIIDWIIWAIFVIDVCIRFFKAENKLEYIKKNPLDIIAIIPLDSIFRLARLARVFRIIRIISMSAHFFNPVFKILHTNGLHKLITFTFVLVFISAIPVYLVEPGITTYEDALWWSVVTTTTVGYGDMSPVTFLGRSVAVVLMIIGIGLISMITGTIATYFLSSEKKSAPSTVIFIKQELDRYDELTIDDMDTLLVLLGKMREQKKHTARAEKADPSRETKCSPLQTDSYPYGG